MHLKLGIIMLLRRDLICLPNTNLNFPTIIKAENYARHQKTLFPTKVGKESISTN